MEHPVEATEYRACGVDHLGHGGRIPKVRRKVHGTGVKERTQLAGRDGI